MHKCEIPPFCCISRGDYIPFCHFAMRNLYFRFFPKPRVQGTAQRLLCFSHSSVFFKSNKRVLNLIFLRNINVMRVAVNMGVRQEFPNIFEILMTLFSWKKKFLASTIHIGPFFASVEFMKYLTSGFWHNIHWSFQKI